MDQRESRPLITYLVGSGLIHIPTRICGAFRIAINVSILKGDG